MNYKAIIKTKRSFSKGWLKGKVKIYFARLTGLSVMVLQEDYDKLLKKLGVDSLRGKEAELIVICQCCCRYDRCPYIMVVDGKSIDTISCCPYYRPKTGDTNG